MPHDSTFTRSATPRANSYDPATRTFEAVIATANPVRRKDQLGPYDEILTVSTLQASEGMPLIDSHNTSTVRAVLGRVLSTRPEGDALVARIQLSAAEDVQPIAARIADGTLTGMSIGYPVAGWTTRQTPQGRVKTPTSWRITEVSLTSNPADQAARIRQEKESPMPEDQVTTQPTPEEAETQRRSDIRALVRSAGLGPEVADQLIDAQADMTRAKAEVFDTLQTRNAARPIIRVHGSSEDPAVIRQRMEEALVCRMMGGDVKPEVRPFMGMTLLDHMRASAERAGISTRGKTTDDLIRAGEMTTSDFPLLVSNAMGKTALASYQAAESPLKKLGRQRSLSNFKTSTAIRLGELGRLEELDESGEIKHVTRAESGETMQLGRYAAGINVSDILIINDDLGMLGDMTAAFGEAAAQTEADILVGLATGNPPMADGTAVFHSSRGNIAASGEPLSSVTAGAALELARKHFRQVKGTDGKTLINVQPKYLLCGPENEAAAERLLAAIYAATVDDVNVHANKLTLLIEPRITDLSWFLFSDPARLAALQYGYLSSAQGVQIQRAEAWSTLGLKFRAWLDFGAGWLDWRAAYLNEGA